MLYHSTFRLDMTRAHEWLACLWQGPAPADLKVREWMTLSDVEPRTTIFVWEGGDAAKAFVDRVFGTFGEIDTREATGSTGMEAAFARDLDAYETMMRQRGTDSTELARQLDLRRRGMAAATPQAAVEAARAWKADA